MSKKWYEEGNWTVYFSGDKHDANANGAMARVPRNIRFGRGRGTDNRQQRSNLSAMKETVFVLRRSVPKIIGRGGRKIRELQEITGASIMISKEYSGDDVPITLSGREEEIRNARELIEDLNSGSYQNQNERYARSNEGLNDHSDFIEKVIQIRSSDCGRIIGRGGSKIKALQEESGARIELKREEASDDMTPVFVRGSKGCVEKAESLIKDIVGDYEFDEERSSDDPFMIKTESGMRVDWTGLYNYCQEQKKIKWAKLGPIKKNFYIEDSNVADMLPHEAEEWRSQNFNITVTHLVENDPHAVLNPVLKFEQAFKHYPEVLETISHQKFQKPSPIQSQVWPLALRGYDVIGIAQTGTGKTLAFLLPAFIHIDGQPVPRSQRKGPSCLILTPTRELALQIEVEIKKYHYRDIRCVCVYGGGDRRKQIDLVKQGVEIIVATPGRFNDLLRNEFVSLNSVSFLVLDEADRMLDMGFEPQIKMIMDDIRPDRQTMMTSATWPQGVRRLARSYLADPMQVAVGSLDLAAVHTVEQIVEVVAQGEKKARLFDFIHSMEENDKVLVFVGRKSTVDDLASDLVLMDIRCQAFHGGHEQSDREQSLDDFKTGYARVLVATDVASRGLDVADVTHVFNYDYPRNTEEYVHRIGRTGRAGKSGTSITLVTTDDWSTAKELIDILVKAQQNVPIELYEMAERYAKKKERREQERGRRGRGGFRRQYKRW